MKTFYQKKILAFLLTFTLIMLGVILYKDPSTKYAVVAQRRETGKFTQWIQGKPEPYFLETDVEEAPPEVKSDTAAAAKQPTLAPPPPPEQQQQQQQQQQQPLSQTDNIPESLRGLINSTEVLKGRHSDYHIPLCQDPHNMYQWNTEKIYDFVGPFKYLENYKNPCWLEENKRLRCVPYFYLIGAPKAGSTDIFHRIEQHPQILQGKGKEIRWFDRKRYTHKEYRNFSDFLNFFDKATKDVEKSTISHMDFHPKVIGDGGPTYFFSSYYWRQMPGNEGCSEPRVTAMSHIHHLWPKAKLILLARNPTTRLYSVYHFNYKETGANRTPEQFHEWLKQGMELWNSCLRNNSFRHCMYEGTIDWNSKVWTLHVGLYSRYIIDILKVFPREQLLIVPTEEYSENTLEWMRKIFKFLDLDEISEEELQAIAKIGRANTTKGKKRSVPMFNETKKILDDFYRPYNKEMADILGIKYEDFSWLNS